MRSFRPEMVLAALLISATPAASQTSDKAMSLDSILNMTVSSASRYDQTMLEAPASVSVITAEEIERYAVETLADALALLAGFYTSYDLNYSYVGVRGFGRPTDYNNRVLLLVNGQSINEPEYGSAPFGTEFPVPLMLVDRIEVVRGPGSVLYGTGAMTAVVNVITKTAGDIERFRARAEFGSQRHRSMVVAGGHHFNNGSALQVTGHWKQNDGSDRYFKEFDNGASDGIARELDADESKGGYVSFSNRGLLITAGSFERTKQVPTASWNAQFNHRDTWTTDRRTKIGLKYRHGLSARMESFVGARYEHYEYVGNYPSDEYTFNDATTARWARAEGGLLWDINSHHRLIAGLEFTKVIRTDYRTYFDGVGDSNFDIPFDVGAAYAQMESRLTERLTTVIGLSQDRRTGNISFTSPRVALIYTASPTTTVKALYGQAFRAPNPYELYSDAAWSGTVAATALKPERIATTEVTFDQRIAKHGIVSGTVYRNAIDDLIDYVPVAGQQDGGDYMNNARVLGTGVEVALRLREWSGHSAFASGSFQLTEDVGSDEQLSNSPEWLFKAGWNASFASRLSAGLFVLHESGRLTLGGSKTSAFTRIDGTLAVSATRQLKVTAAVRNLSGVDYALPGGAEHKQSILPQNGRTIVLRLDAYFK